MRTFRISTNTLGNGFVECVANETLLAIRDAQPAEMRGTAVMVPVLEGRNALRVGRFGWKNQHASLESFSADAYLNEMGITSPLFPDENTSSGRYVGSGTPFDPVADPEDDGVDVLAFANFMRSTKAPSRGRDHARGAGWRSALQPGRVRCLPRRDAAHGAAGYANQRRRASASRSRSATSTIHPYSDFLLHDIGTGDGIPVLPGPEYAATSPLIRTAPLWALRTRNRLMHDGLSFTKQEAIQRHGSQAAAVRDRYNALTDQQRSLVLTFLESL